MLENDPPPGTKVRFVREIKKAKAFDTATLVKAMQKYTVDRPEDEFIVEFQGEQYTVRRSDIEKAQ